MDVEVIYKDFTKLSSSFLKISFITLEKVLMAFFRPHGITSHSKSSFSVVITVFFISFF